MKITQITSDTSNYTKNRTSKIQYIVIHYTANNGDTAIGNGKYFQGKNRNASAHLFVDDNNIVQSVPDNDVAWHCGAKKYIHKYCRNDNSIGIEMCSRKDSKGDYYITKDTVEKTIYLTKYLMKKYNIPITNVLRHYDVTGKMCPQPFVVDVNLWNNFKKELNNVNENNCKFVNRPYKYKDNKMNTNVINRNGENYIRIRDLANLLNMNVKYDQTTKTTILEDKE